MFSENKVTHDISRAKKFFEDIISYTVGPYDLNEIIEHRINTVNIVDVRDYDDYNDGHIPYAVHIPAKQIQESLEMFDKDKVTIVYTYTDSCPRAYKVAFALLEKHYPSVVLRGGFKEWKKFDFDIIKNDSPSDFKSNNE